jgi:hypothetical protein
MSDPVAAPSTSPLSPCRAASDPCLLRYCRNQALPSPDGSQRKRWVLLQYVLKALGGRSDISASYTSAAAGPALSGTRHTVFAGVPSGIPAGFGCTHRWMAPVHTPNPIATVRIPADTIAAQIQLLMRFREAVGEPDTSAGAEAPRDSANAVANCPALSNRFAGSTSIATLTVRRNGSGRSGRRSISALRSLDRGRSLRHRT